MPWTQQDQLRALMRVPWTVRPERNEAGGYIVARVAELPDVIATGQNDRELMRDLWDSLEASLECRLESGDDIPLPAGVQLPWAAGEEPPAAPRRVQMRHEKEWDEVSTSWADAGTELTPAQ